MGEQGSHVVEPHTSFMSIEWAEIVSEFDYMIQFCTETTELPCLVQVMTTWNRKCPFCGHEGPITSA